MWREIKIKVVEELQGLVMFCIEDMSQEMVLRLRNFPIRARGWEIRSDTLPEIRYDEKILYVWGGDRRYNSNILETTPENLQDLFVIFEEIKGLQSIEDEFFSRSQLAII